MNERILKFADSKQYLGKIARSGENNTRSLAFDCSAALDEYPAAQIIAVIQRPQGDPYTVTPEADGMIRRITLTVYDLEFNGHLHIELRVIDGEKILKSAIYTATVDDSIRGEADAPGKPVRDVLDRLDAEIKQAQAVVDDIRQKLENGEFNGSDAEVTAANIQSALGYKPVKDVQVADVSVLKDGVANVPMASSETAGVIKVENAWYCGLYMHKGALRIAQSPNSEISTRAGGYRPITPANLDYAVKAAMCDGKGAAWTSDEQKAARERMGVDGGYELIEEITIVEENVSVIARDVDRLCSAKLVIICPPMESIITANALILFGNASKPEYIYLFGEIAPTKVGVYRHITLEAELRNNYWRAYKTAENDAGSMYPNGSWTTGVSETAPSRLMQLPSSDLDAITKITINAFPTDAYIPVGTKITIYGVRA